MEFTEYTNTWAKSEVLQGKIMITVGIFLSVAFIAIYRGENQLLRGSLIPLSLLLAVLLGYSPFLFYSRPAHAKEIIQLYQKNPKEAVKQETAKHTNETKTGKLIMRIFLILMLISVIAFILVSASYYKGLALGFVLLFGSFFIIDNGFVSRSNAFLSFLNKLA